eukprot:2022869-Rhodomonas_salina.1
MFIQKLRPSLTQMANVSNTANGLIPNGYMNEHENFVSFAKACRFPLHMNMTTQRYVYFLKCLHDPDGSGVDTTEHVEAIIHCPVLLGNVKTLNVVNVDLPIILN